MRLNQAAESVAEFLFSEAPNILFTPGASSALWIAIDDVVRRCAGRTPHVLASAIEHPSLLHHLVEAERRGRLALTIFPVDERGQPDLDALRRLGRNGADLVCMMAANNETGVVSPLLDVAQVARDISGRLLVDASQAAGRFAVSPFAAHADYLIASGAKMYGPRHVGVLSGALMRKTRDEADVLFGTPDVAAACAMARACEYRRDEMIVDEHRIATLRNSLEERLIAEVPGLIVNGDQTARLAGVLHVSAPGVPGDAVVARVSAKLAVSTGAACQSGVPGPSHVLSAMKVPEWVSDGALRICVGKFNTEDDVAKAGDLLTQAMAQTSATLRRYA